MPLTGEYAPSAWEPVAEQVRLFEQTDGAEGAEFMGGPCIILTTLGARSGKLRKTPLIRVEKDGTYVVIGSMGGAPADPQWTHNLRAHPRADLQDGPVVHELVAREAHGEEKAMWWSIATQVWPDYDTYQAATERVIPLFVLEPQAG
ncbi:MAG: nitroreductase family deazaflavin-dependent oxidoreductase [Mycobacteriales bacterium]